MPNWQAEQKFKTLVLLKIPAVQLFNTVLRVWKAGCPSLLWSKLTSTLLALAMKAFLHDRWWTVSELFSEPEGLQDIEGK